MKAQLIYRCCEAETLGKPRKHIRPSWFDKRRCFCSLRASLRDDVDLHIVHDGIQGELYEYILRTKRVNDTVHNITCGTNSGSLTETFRLADELFSGGVEVVYFVEDDFLHSPNAVDVIIKGAQSFGLVTGFDHLDRYKRTDDVTHGHEFVAFSSKTNCHWRTAESTTCTWACDRDTWNKIRDDVYEYKLRDRELFRSLISKGVRLWTPIPGVSTTLDVTTFSPGVDWAGINNSITID